MTMNETWGYKSYATNWKSTETLVRNLIDIASKSGNFLLNVGPKADGTIPIESVNGLREMGAWMKVNGEAIYGTKGSPFAPIAWGRCTMKEGDGATTLYFHVFDWPKDGVLTLPAITSEIISASVLGSKQKLKVTKSDAGYQLAVGQKAPDAIATVVNVQVKGAVK
jgi:alpha-L-fucosidase